MRNKMNFIRRMKRPKEIYIFAMNRREKKVIIAAEAVQANTIKSKNKTAHNAHNNDVQIHKL